MAPVFGLDTYDRVRSALAAVRSGPVAPHRQAAAVLVPLFDDDGEVRVLLTKRSQHLRRHTGEISFPGGTREPGDADLEATALREAHEEVGLDPGSVERLGVLDDMPTSASGYLIRPVVARIPHPYPFVLDPGEVERVLSPPLAFFAEPDNRHVEHWERDGVRYPVYFFHFRGDVVWGATARLLVALLERLDGREPSWTAVPAPPASVEEDLSPDRD